MPKPAIMPREAPHLLARFQKMPRVKAGKKAAAANEKAADTKNRMSAIFKDATYAAAKATNTKSLWRAPRDG